MKFQNEANFCASIWKHFLCSGGTCFPGAANCSATRYPTGVLCQKPLTASMLRWINRGLVVFCFYMGIFSLSAFDKKTTLHYWTSSLNLAQAPGVLVLYISLNWDKPCNGGLMPNWICCWSRRIECNKYPHRLEKPSLLSSILHVRHKFRKPQRKTCPTLYIWSAVELFCILFQIL